MDVKLHFIVVLIYISLMIIYVAHIFMCFLAVFRYLEKCIFKSFAYFKIGFLLLNCSSYIFLILISEQMYELHMFSLIAWVAFSFFTQDCVL